MLLITRNQIQTFLMEREILDSLNAGVSTFEHACQVLSIDSITYVYACTCPIALHSMSSSYMFKSQSLRLCYCR